MATNTSSILSRNTVYNTANPTSAITTKPKSASESILVPEVCGHNKMEKHFSNNIDVLDLNKPNDVYADNLEQNIIDFDYENASINISSRELTPKCNVSNIKCNLNSDDDTNTKIRKYTNKNIDETQYNMFTLPTTGEEKIINCGNEYVYTSKESVLDRETQYDAVEVSPRASNNIGSLVDCFIVNTDDNNNYEPESFDNINISKKDFNIVSESSTKSVKNLVGKIKDATSEFNFPSYTFTPHIDETQSVKLTRKSRYITDKSSSSESGLAITFDDILIKKFTNEEDLNKDVNDYDIFSSNQFPAFIPAGIHKVGIVRYVGNDEYKIYTKFPSNIDFLMNGDSEHLYKNINRPIVYKKNDSTIYPMISQSYRFNRDYILSSIKPHFIFPTFPDGVKNLMIIVTYGFLINGKIKESGIISTRILTYSEFVGNEGKIDALYPIWIPKNTDFFIGFTVATNGNSDFTEENLKDVVIKCIENGEYDKNGNLVSFPSDVKTRMFIKDIPYNNKMIKMDLFVNTYKTNNSTTPYEPVSFKNIFVTDISRHTTHDVINYKIKANGEPYALNEKKIKFKVDTTKYSAMEYGLDRVIFLNSDIIPDGSNTEYFIIDMSEMENVYGTLNANKEFISKEHLDNYRYELRMSTNDKYVSPIIRYDLHNYLTKNYICNNGENMQFWGVSLDAGTKLCKPSNLPSFLNPELNWNGGFNFQLPSIFFDESYIGGTSFVDIRLKNLKGTYTANTSSEMFGANELIKGNIKGNEFLIRLNFDYWLSDFTDMNVSSNTAIYANLTAINKITGIQYKNCRINNYFYNQNGVLGNNIDGSSIIDEKLNDDWRNKTYEFVPLVPFKEDNVYKYIPIVNVEDWEFVLRLWLPDHDGTYNPLAIRNVKVSVDTMQYSLESN